MKLASLALFAGGAAFGAVGFDRGAQEELRTKALVIEGDRADARITSSPGGGVLVALGQTESGSSAQLEVRRDAGGWSMELREPEGACVKARVADHSASLDLLSAPEHSRAQLAVGRLGESPGDGFGNLGFYNDDAPTPAGSFGFSGRSGRLNVNRVVESGEYADGESWHLVHTLLQVSEAGSIGPWQDDER